MTAGNSRPKTSRIKIPPQARWIVRPRRGTPCSCDVVSTACRTSTTLPAIPAPLQARLRSAGSSSVRGTSPLVLPRPAGRQGWVRRAGATCLIRGCVVPIQNMRRRGDGPDIEPGQSVRPSSPRRSGARLRFESSRDNPATIGSASLRRPSSPMHQWSCMMSFGDIVEGAGNDSPAPSSWSDSTEGSLSRH